MLSYLLLCVLVLSSRNIAYLLLVSDRFCIRKVRGLSLTTALPRDRVSLHSPAYILTFDPLSRQSMVI
jgi:hypothetical protein